MTAARSVRVKGIVQGVGFRPFVYRLALANALTGWVVNEEEGVEIHLEGAEPDLEGFLAELRSAPPPAARILSIEIAPAEGSGFTEFRIRESHQGRRPTTGVSPDLAVCEDCLAELFHPGDRRYRYPYINCTNCGPRYSIVLGLPYDRCNTTMRSWPLDGPCAAEYEDPGDRRFHAQPVACPACGPHYSLAAAGPSVEDDDLSIARSAGLLRQGRIVAIKGIGGYHLACDAANASAVAALRERKFRKEKPFALMARDPGTARQLARFSPEGEALLTAAARPIVLAPARMELPGIAPDQAELGVMLPYAPLHYLLFDAGAPPILVMTSGNRSSEPVAYEDADARERLSGLADAFLVGDRPIARRVDDSVVRDGALGPVMLRRSRGYAPQAVARLPASTFVLAMGADLKNSIALAVDGEVYVSQYIGDLDHYSCEQALEQTIADLTAMYDVPWQHLTVVHDAHPEYRSTLLARRLPCARRLAVQHHRAHIASVLAENQAWDQRVAGICFDGTGYGDDGSIWGGEFFAGSLAGGLVRVGRLRCAALPGGDAAARHPVQAAAGFLAQIDELPDLLAPPFDFPSRYMEARRLMERQLRTFQTSSVGRLFDTAAALTGFARAVSYEGQAAMWLENLARRASTVAPYSFPFLEGELDFRPALQAIARDRAAGRAPADIARAFHEGLIAGVAGAAVRLCEAHDCRTVVLSGGVFQNELLLSGLAERLRDGGLTVWTNHAVPPNDGGICLGQAALAAFAGENADA